MTNEMAELLGKLASRLSERRAELLHAKADQARAAAAIVGMPGEKEALLKTAAYMDAEANVLAHLKRAKKKKNGK